MYTNCTALIDIRRAEVHCAVQPDYVRAWMDVKAGRPAEPEQSGRQIAKPYDLADDGHCTCTFVEVYAMHV